MAEDNINLNELVTKEGEVLDENKSTIKKGDDAEVILDNMISTVSNPGIMPGEKINLCKADDVAFDKKDAEKTLIEQVAFEKIKKEKAEYDKLSDEAKLKDFLFQSEANKFFRNNHYEMNGSQKRYLRRDIERKWAKGKFKNWVKAHGDDILFELNKASQQQVSANGSSVQGNTGQPVTSLNSLINPIR